ncbi:hypothetical protein KP509_21G086100 [Ceratopteris richardii]|nr:hypothetical protein KP509_21G086100 [Ceratopteris richardii]
MAATATPSAVSSTSGLSLPSRCHAPVAANTSSASAKLRLSRRLLLPSLVAAPLLLQQQSAFAKDIPLFGIRKRVEQAEKAVEKEVKEIVKEGKELVKEGEDLVKEGEKELTAAAAAVVSKPAIDSPPPAYQAAGVAGAELVAVLIASSIVNGLVSES